MPKPKDTVTLEREVQVNILMKADQMLADIDQYIDEDQEIEESEEDIKDNMHMLVGEGDGEEDEHESEPQDIELSHESEVEEEEDIIVEEPIGVSASPIGIGASPNDDDDQHRFDDSLTSESDNLGFATSSALQYHEPQTIERLSRAQGFELESFQNQTQERPPASFADKYFKTKVGFYRYYDKESDRKAAKDYSTLLLTNSNRSQRISVIGRSRERADSSYRNDD